MKRITTLLLCLLFTHFSFGQDTTITNDTNKPITNIENATGNSQSQQSGKPVINVNDGIANHNFSEVDSVKKYPKALYESSLLNKPHWSASDKWQFFSSLALLLALIIGGSLLAKNSSMCRDEAYCIEGNLQDKQKSPYSYARIQLFWWTVIILGAYVVFFGLTGCLLPLNMTTVILLCMGIGVLAGGKLIDNKEIKDNTIPLGSRNQDKIERNSNFLFDILSDEKGVSLHRFQAVVFNAVIGIGFLGYFFKSFTAQRYPFPDFSEGVFALLGVSASAYLGMKAAENKTANGIVTIDNAALNGFKALEEEHLDTAVSEFNNSQQPHREIGNTIREIRNTLTTIDDAGVQKIIKQVLDKHESIIPSVFKISLAEKIK